MHLGYQSWKTGCEGGAMTFLTALTTAEHVCMASGRLLYRRRSAVCKLTGDFRRPVLLLLLLCLFTEQAAIGAP